MPEQEIPAEDAADAMYEVGDDGDSITERDKIASEVHELITEERLEAAAEAAEAADGFSGATCPQACHPSERAARERERNRPRTPCCQYLQARPGSSSVLLLYFSA